MAAMTFEQMVQFLKDRNVGDSSARTIRNYTKIIHDANFALHNEGKFEFDRRSAALNIAALISTATVTLGTGTAVTGAGTNFTSWQMAGKYLRVANDSLMFRVASVASATSAELATNYICDGNPPAGASFQLTQPRLTLPAHFRDFADPVLTTGWGKLQPMDLEELISANMAGRSAADPAHYAIEWEESGGEKLPYLWLYPAPLNKRSVAFAYYQWPTQPSEDDDTFGLPVDAEPVLREYCKAFLAQEQYGDGTPAAEAAMQRAKSICKKALAHFLPRTRTGLREQWTPAGDEGGSGQAPLYLPLRG